MGVARHASLRKDDQAGTGGRVRLNSPKSAALWSARVAVSRRIKLVPECCYLNPLEGLAVQGDPHPRYISLRAGRAAAYRSIDPHRCRVSGLARRRPAFAPRNTAKRQPGRRPWRRSPSPAQARRLLPGALHIFAVTTAILIDPVRRKLQNAIGKCRQETAIVRNEQHRALIGRERLD